MRSHVTSYLEKSPFALNLCAMSMGFFAYFCMYAFRKPFAAGTYDGLAFFGSEINLKTAFVICQIIGYALSKYLGIKFCPEVTRNNRAKLLIMLVIAAEIALVLFAILPEQMKIGAIFLNGLSLGMVWGLIVWYLEGRQTSEILLAVLSCSFIVSSGIVKDVGRANDDEIYPPRHRRPDRRIQNACQQVGSKPAVSCHTAKSSGVTERHNRDAMT